jgi:hypothetical protein
MNANDLIFTDLSRWIQNINYSRQLKQNFDAYLAKNPADDTYHVWDIAVTGEDLWVHAFSSPANTPLAGVTRYVNNFNLEAKKSDASSSNIIPEILRKRPQWIWLSQSTNKSADRLTPYLSRGVKDGDGLLRENWMQFSHLVCEYGDDFCGNAYVLNDDEIIDGFRLVVIEINPKSGLNHNDVRKLWIALGKPYLEYSKDGHGWTILGLVDRQLPSINCYGVKIFTGDDFVELSGLGAEGSLIDISKEVLSFHAYRLPFSSHKKTIFNPRPNTPREIARLKEMLNFISADCSYDIYMRVIWGILSTGWPEAEKIALNWSLTAIHRFEQKTFNDLVKCYDPDRPGAPTMGTIFHLARAGGWRG